MYYPGFHPKPIALNEDAQTIMLIAHQVRKYITYFKSQMHVDLQYVRRYTQFLNSSHKMF